MPITMAPAGERLVIRKITGRNDMRQRLAELGFVIGADVTVVNSLAGNLIIQIRDSRIALDRTLAGRIIV